MIFHSYVKLPEGMGNLEHIMRMALTTILWPLNAIKLTLGFLGYSLMFETTHLSWHLLLIRNPSQQHPNLFVISAPKFPQFHASCKPL